MKRLSIKTAKSMLEYQEDKTELIIPMEYDESDHLNVNSTSILNG